MPALTPATTAKGEPCLILTLSETMKKQFESAVNPSPLMTLSRQDVCNVLRSFRSGHAMGILKKVENGYSINARLWVKAI